MPYLFDEEVQRSLYDETMKREIRAEGREEGRAEGLPEGKIELLIDPVKGGKLSAAEGAKQLNISITEFESLP